MTDDICVEVAQPLKDKIIIYSSLFKPLQDRLRGGGSSYLVHIFSVAVFCLFHKGSVRSGTIVFRGLQNIQFYLLQKNNAIIDLVGLVTL